MSPRNFIFLIAAVALLMIPASAAVTNATIETTVISTVYLDFNIWIFITLLGFGFLILSNIVDVKRHNAALWALIAPFFMWPAAYFAGMIQTMSYVPTVDQYGMIHIVIQQTVFNIPWLQIVLGIMALFTTINFFYIITKKDSPASVEKPTRRELDTRTDSD